MYTAHRVLHSFPTRRSSDLDLIGQDAAVLAERAGFKIPVDAEIIFGETEESHPFVDLEQMMPFVPFVRVPDVNTAIALAKDRKSTRLNSSHTVISYAVFCLK